MLKLSSLAFLLVTGLYCSATTYVSSPGNYTSFIAGLQAGDTLYFTNGTYTNRLNLNGKNGTASDPIVFIGASPNGVIFTGNACCNTVSITQCSYLVIKNFTLDGLNIVGIDAVKAEGSPGNWAHHITLENLKIIGHGGDQQNVGISTKCAVWDWVIRRCIIDGAGTGMYLGNSTGDSPFVNGLLEGNVVKNTVGYNVQIKHEIDGLRTIPNMTLNGKTVIRYNVFTKELNASTGPNARPCVLVGAYPSTGNGSGDFYEIYNNFFYQNPVEALFQGTGHVTLYNNVFVNHQSGGWGVEIREHTGFQPRNINVFHNTVIVTNGTGINFYNCNATYQQNAVANAVFASTPIQSNTSINNTDNLTGTYFAATANMNSPLTNVPVLDVYPQTGQMTGTNTSSAPFNTFQNYANDFNDCPYNWVYRGAYSGDGTNPGWTLQIDTMMMGSGCSTLWVPEHEVDLHLTVYPNPSSGVFSCSLSILSLSKGRCQVPGGRCQRIEITNLQGEKVDQVVSANTGDFISVDLSNYPAGVYFLGVETAHGLIRTKILLIR